MFLIVVLTCLSLIASEVGHPSFVYWPFGMLWILLHFQDYAFSPPSVSTEAPPSQGEVLWWPHTNTFQVSLTEAQFCKRVGSEKSCFSVGPMSVMHLVDPLTYNTHLHLTMVGLVCLRFPEKESPALLCWSIAKSHHSSSRALETLYWPWVAGWGSAPKRWSIYKCNITSLLNWSVSCAWSARPTMFHLSPGPP